MSSGFLGIGVGMMIERIIFGSVASGVIHPRDIAGCRATGMRTRAVSSGFPGSGRQRSSARSSTSSSHRRALNVAPVPRPPRRITSGFPVAGSTGAAGSGDPDTGDVFVRTAPGYRIIMSGRHEVWSLWGGTGITGFPCEGSSTPQSIFLLPWSPALFLSTGPTAW